MSRERLESSFGKKEKKVKYWECQTPLCGAENNTGRDWCWKCGEKR